MQKHRLLILTLFAAVVFAGCVTAPEEPSRVRLGMSDDDLRFFFGEPLRIEAVDTGGEVWYYRVVSASTPAVDGAAWQDPYTGSGAVEVSLSPSAKIRQECPIFLSADGHVIEPVPQAHIRGR